MKTSLIRFLNIISGALLAGVSFGILIGFNPVDLSASSYLEQQQNMLHSLRTLMISLVIGATIITILSAYIQKNDRPVFIVLFAAAICFIACILITRFGNIPIDDIVKKWTINSMPNNWTDLRDKWWTFHIMRTIAELIALSLVTWVSIRRD